MDDGGDGALPYGAQVAASLHRLALSDAADGAGEWCVALLRDAPRGGAQRHCVWRLRARRGWWCSVLYWCQRVVCAAVGEVGSSDARRNAVRRAAVAPPVRGALVALVALLKERSTKLQARPFRKPHCAVDAPLRFAKRAEPCIPRFIAHADALR
jgi:hypothetical protein